MPSATSSTTIARLCDRPGYGSYGCLKYCDRPYQDFKDTLGLCGVTGTASDHVTARAASFGAVSSLPTTRAVGATLSEALRQPAP